MLYAFLLNSPDVLLVNGSFLSCARSILEIDDALASHGTPSPVATVESLGPYILNKRPWNLPLL
jgi:hypothetical protein